MSERASTYRDLPTSGRGGRPGWRLLAGGLTTALVGAALVGLPAAPAQAGECAKQTGGSNDWVMWTGSKYTCAYQGKMDKKKIGSFATQTWTSSTAFGYTKRDHRWNHTGGVKISYIYYDGGGTIGSSITFTAWNSEDGSRHWAANVMWNTASGGKIASDQYKGKDYAYKTNRFHISKISTSGPTTGTAGTPVSYTVKVTDPDGGTTPAGTVVLMLQPGSKPSPTKTDCSGKVTSQGNDSGIAKASLSSGSATLKTPALAAGTYKLYAVYTGSRTSKDLPLYCASPSNDGLTGAQSSTWTLTVGAPVARTSSPAVRLSAARGTITPDVVAEPSQRAARTPQLAVVDRTFVLGRNGGSGARKMACPTGWAPLQINAASPTRVLPEKLLSRSGRTMRVLDGAAPEGTRVDVQIVCRERKAGARSDGNAVVGSVRGDRLTTRKPGTTVLAGAGDDTVRVTTRLSSAFGFTGDDHIVVTSALGAAHGGPGHDVLEARRPGAVVLVGGVGRDTFYGAAGRTLINARDGAGGDRIVCRSSANVVLADEGDVISGPCTVR